MDKRKIHICLACDNKYAQHAGVVIASVLVNANSDDELCFYILDGKISEENRNLLSSLKSIKDYKIEFISITEEQFQDYKSVKTHKYISLTTFFRLKLPSLLPSLNKVIYFDCDYVINTSLNELYNMDISDYYLAGVHDIKKKMLIKNPTYVNAGMLIFNLEKMREFKIENEFLSWTMENLENITCGDQEIINEVCKGNIKILNDDWNVQSSNFTNRSCFTQNPKGIHFISKKKPWHFASYSYHKDYYFKYLQLTPWALNGIKKFWWLYVNKLASLIGYIGYRPFFLFRPKFYKAFYNTYIVPLKKGGNV